MSKQALMMSETRSEIAFFDLETTIPTKQGQGYAVLEFGAILVCPKTLVEVDSYSTLICPNDMELISALSERCNGISRVAVSSAPSFALVADKVFDILNGRIWAGHNILNFDCPRIREAFAEINRPPPEPKGFIDSYPLLTERFGRRAGNMKMATLATYFGLGQQTHRSLDDVRMNLEVIKYCATVLFLESSLPNIQRTDSWVSPSTSRNTRNGGRFPPVMMSHTPNSIPTTEINGNQTFGTQTSDSVEPSGPATESLDLKMLPTEEMMTDAMQEDNVSSSSSSEFWTPNNISVSSITASSIPFYHGSRKIHLLHKGLQLKLVCSNLKVRFGISTKFVDHADRPRLSFVVDAPPDLCHVLDACDSHAQGLFIDSGCSSDWRPVVTRKIGYWNNFPTVRFHIPTVVTGDIARYGTEIFQKSASAGAEQKLEFSKFDPAELERLFISGTLVDAFFSLDQYDIQLNAGLRLVAEKLVIHSP